jgi:radical SAM superfamily enzyme YgiQ (UPF0313 family)
VNILLYKIIENFPVVDLNQLSIPGWKVIFKNYIPRMSFLGSGPAVNINASRGCPYSCFYYCVYPLQQGRKLRLKSSDKLISEMKYLHGELKVNNFLFRDPVFSIDKKHTLEICDKIIDEDLKFNIGIETHLKNIDFDLADKLKKAGVKLMYVGIESGDIDVRKNSHRTSENNDEQLKKISYLEKIGIKVKAMYIIGMPSDTKEKFLSTLEYAKRLNSSYAQFSVFTPYPGTPAFKDYKEIITTYNTKSDTITIQLDSATYANTGIGSSYITLATGEQIKKEVNRLTKTYYQYEDEQNENKREIKLLKPEFAFDLIQEFRTVIK